MNPSSPAKCTFNVYNYLVGTTPNSPDYDAPAGFQSTANSTYGCNTGKGKFGSVDSSLSFKNAFTSLSNTQDTTVTPMRDTNLKKNYCAFSVNLASGQTCIDLKYNSGTNFYVANSSNTQLTGASGTFIPAVAAGTFVSAIDVTCGTGGSARVIPYAFTNSTVAFNTSNAVPQLEFTPIDNKILGCQYGNDDTYLSFACTSNTTVDAAQYSCGL